MVTMNEPRMVIKNKRLKMSPAGLITLPVCARRCLGMVKGSGATINCGVKTGTIILSSGQVATESLRISPGGMVELPADAKATLLASAKRHYWLELHDEAKTVVLHQFSE